MKIWHKNAFLHKIFWAPKTPPPTLPPLLFQICGSANGTVFWHQD